MEYLKDRISIFCKNEVFRGQDQKEGKVLQQIHYFSKV